MPELPEVERARKVLHAGAVGKTVTDAASVMDEIVFGSKETAERFPEAVKGRKVLDVQRKGKQFWMVLDGHGPQPLFHFGMSGFCAFKGEEPLYYRKKPKETTDEWPPKYHRASLTLTADDGSVTDWAFCDARRLGRVKLIDAQDPLTEPPLSLLGRDPFLDPMTIEELGKALSRKKAPIKAVLLDQNGPYCGIGNWVADEICFHARIHPGQVACTLSSDQIANLHEAVKNVVNLAVEVDADSHKFPEGWLFPHRWSKGKKGVPLTFKMSNGESTKITFSNVGGRTSAITDVQKLPPGYAHMVKRARGGGQPKANEEDVYESADEEQKTESESKNKNSPDPKRRRRN